MPSKKVRYKIGSAKSLTDKRTPKEIAKSMFYYDPRATPEKVKMITNLSTDEINKLKTQMAKLRKANANKHLTADQLRFLKNFLENKKLPKNDFETLKNVIIGPGSVWGKRWRLKGKVTDKIIIDSFFPTAFYFFNRKDRMAEQYRKSLFYFLALNGIGMKKIGLEELMLRTGYAEGTIRSRHSYFLTSVLNTIVETI